MIFSKARRGRKSGWTLAELMIAIMALSILAGLTVKVINTDKSGRKAPPFAYAGMENLRLGNVRLMEEEKISELPKGAAAVNESEPYCTGVADLFSVTTKVGCDAESVSDGGTPPAYYAADGKFNFQARNQVAYSGLNSKWRTGATTGDPVAPGADLEYKLITIGINGLKPDDTPNCPEFNGAEGSDEPYIGKDCFNLHVFKNGSVTPAGKCLNRKNELVPCVESDYPFTYEVWEIHRPDEANEEDDNKCTQGDPSCRISTRVLPKPEDRSPGISYAAAYCAAEQNRDIEDSARILSKTYCAGSQFEEFLEATTATGRDYTDLDTGLKVENSSLELCGTTSGQYCVVKMVKPSMTAFKWAPST